jgi:hypothetical protein
MPKDFSDVDEFEISAFPQPEYDPAHHRREEYKRVIETVFAEATVRSAGYNDDNNPGTGRSSDAANKFTGLTAKGSGPTLLDDYMQALQETAIDPTKARQSITPGKAGRLNGNRSKRFDASLYMKRACC